MHAELAEEIREKTAVADAVSLAAARCGLLYYLDRIVINAQPTPKRFGECADDWQREMIAPLVPAFEHLAGLTEAYAGPTKFMQILARGHDKSSLEARLCVWTLLASRRAIHGYILAADRDQGRLVIQAMEDEARLNPWAYRDIDINKNVVSGPAGTVEVLPCDAASMYGLRGNLYVCDEFTNWKREREWTAVFSGRHKTNPCLYVVLSNAGVLDTWQHRAYTVACSDPSWHVFHREGTLASWADRKAIEADRKMLPPSEAERLYDNKWVDPAAEHDYLRREEVQACADVGARLGLRYRPRREVGVDNYVAAIDYGSVRDLTALAVVHQDVHGIIRVDRLDVWQGKPGYPVQVSDVQQWIDEVRQRFNPLAFILDPHQMEGTIQWAQGRGINAKPFLFRAGRGNYELAQQLRALIVDARLAWYPEAAAPDGRTFQEELVGLRVKRMPYGYRFDHEAQKHDDMAFAVAVAAAAALEYPGSPGITPFVRVPVHSQAGQEDRIQ